MPRALPQGALVVDGCLQGEQQRAGRDLQVCEGGEIGRRTHPATGRTIIYVACCPVGDIEPIVASSPEVAEVRWVSLDEIDQLLPDLYRPAREHLTALLGGGAPPAD